MKDHRKLAAIMFTDIVGYTALMSKDEQHALRILQKNRDLLKSFIKKFDGEWLQAIGDGTLSSFASVVDAVNCALEVQRSLKSDPELRLRIGIHIGDVISGEGEIYGDGVNVASRLETLAEPGGICISGQVYSEIRNKPDIEAVFLGEKTLKNVDLPMKVYALTVERPPAAAAEGYPAERPSAAKPQPSIVVLPFINMSPDPEQEYFSDGLTEEIITDLSQVHKLLVISRSSAMTFKGTKKKISEIAREVNVQYVLEGSVRKAGNNLRIAAQLIDATNDAHLWAEKYSGTLDDVFDIQEKVSRSIVDALKLKLSPEEKKKISERPIENVQAYECYLRARQEMWRCTEDGSERALRYLENGLDIIGENALLFAGMGLVYCNYYEFGIKADEETLKKAEDFADKVLKLEPNASYSHHLLGMIERFRGSSIKAIKHFKQALTIDPDHTETLLFLSLIYAWHAGKTSEAETLIKRLIEIDPLAPINYLIRGIVHWMEGQLDHALSSFQKMAKLEPESILPKVWSVYVLAWKGQLERAFKLVDQMVKHESHDQMHDIFTGWCLFFKYALLGEKTKALETLNEDVKRYFWNDPDLPCFGACNYALIDEKEQALDWLERAVNRGCINYPLFSELDPFLKNIRGEKRFKKLMEKVKYEWEHFEV